MGLLHLKRRIEEYEERLAAIEDKIDDETYSLIEDLIGTLLYATEEYEDLEEYYREN